MIMKRPPIRIETAAAAHAGDGSSEDDDDAGERKVKSEREKQQVAVVGGGKRHSGTIGSSRFQFGSKGALPSPLGSAHSFDMQVANWRMEKLEVDSKSGSEEEFFDCQGEKRGWKE
jgi:hypothetical protein